MQRAHQIVFRQIPRSVSLEKAIEKRIEKLEKRFNHITGCNVLIEETHNHKHQGKLFHIRIRLNVPERELVVSREKHNQQNHEDPYVAVRDAFNAMEHQLDNYAEKLRGDVKNHSKPMVATSSLNSEIVN